MSETKEIKVGTVIGDLEVLSISGEWAVCICHLCANDKVRRRIKNLEAASRQSAKSACKKCGQLKKNKSYGSVGTRPQGWRPGQSATQHPTHVE